MNFAPNPMAMNLGPTEILLILLVLVLLFGAKKLPELARGSGRALRIFKAETKGLIDDEDGSDGVPDRHKTPEQLQIEASRRESAIDATKHALKPVFPMVCCACQWVWNQWQIFRPTCNADWIYFKSHF